MPGTCDVCMAYEVYACVSTAYVLRSIRICGISVLYQLLLIHMRTNGCVAVVFTLFMQFAHYRTLYQLSEVEDATGEIYII